MTKSENFYLILDLVPYWMAGLTFVGFGLLAATLAVISLVSQTASVETLVDIEFAGLMFLCVHYTAVVIHGIVD